jgi:hypothetical protein
MVEFWLFLVIRYKCYSVMNVSRRFAWNSGRFRSNGCAYFVIIGQLCKLVRNVLRGKTATERVTGHAIELRISVQWKNVCDLPLTGFWSPLIFKSLQGSQRDSEHTYSRVA